MMKKFVPYIALLLFEIIAGLAYGYFLQNIVPIEMYLFINFLVPFVTISLILKKEKDLRVRLVETIVLSLCFIAVPIGILTYGNRLQGKFVDEYTVVVEFVNGRGGGYATFTTPHGETADVDLHDYRVIITDDDYVDVGDTIRVQEYKGYFGNPYYVFVEETDPAPPRITDR